MYILRIGASYSDLAFSVDLLVLTLNERSRSASSTKYSSLDVVCAAASSRIEHRRLQLLELTTVAGVRSVGAMPYSHSNIEHHPPSDDRRSETRG